MTSVKDRFTMEASDFEIVMSKHGNHDQRTHGSWANGAQSGEVVTDLIAWDKAESSKFSSDTEREIYFMDKILSQQSILRTADAAEYEYSINAYQTRMGYTINEALRDPNISTDQVEHLITGIDKAIENAPATTEDMVVYRGIKGNGLDFFEALKPGDIYEDKGYSSTTLDTSTVTKFAVQGSMYQGVVLRMKLPAGTKGIFPASVTGLMQASSREAEFLLPRGSKFKVLNNQGKVWDVEVVNA